MKKISTDNGWMKVKDFASDAMSYPKRTRYNALASVKNKLADDIKTNREIKQSRIKRNIYPN